MFSKKEEQLTKHQQLLTSAKQVDIKQDENHRREMKVLQERLQLEIEEHIRKIKQVHQEYISAPQPAVATNKQLARLQELEEEVVEQDNALAMGSEKQKKTRAQIQQIKETAEKNIALLREEKEASDEQHTAEVKRLNQQIEQAVQTISQKDSEIETLEVELQTAKEANERAPTKTMKSLVERLRNQLAVKEKQLKTLSQALVQLRSDMVTNAEENVQAHAEKARGELNVQKLIEKETTELSSRIEELQSRIEKLKKELKKKRDEEGASADEIESLKKDCARKDKALKDLARELKLREDAEEEMENMKIELRSLRSELSRTKSESADYIADKEDLQIAVNNLKKKLKEAEEKPEVHVKESVITPSEQAPVQSKGIDFSELDDKPVKEVKPKEEVARWEEQKKQQKKVEFLRAKLKEKSEEYDKTEKMNTTLREALARQEKEKISLQNKLKNLAKGGDVPTRLTTLPVNSEDHMHELRKQIYSLQDENSELQKRLAMDKENEVRELRMQIAQQREAIQALETEMNIRQASEDPEASSWQLTREQRFQREMLEIRKENMAHGTTL
jgi:centrosomal protein CEP290